MRRGKETKQVANMKAVCKKYPLIVPDFYLKMIDFFLKFGMILSVKDTSAH